MNTRNKTFAFSKILSLLILVGLHFCATKTLAQTCTSTLISTNVTPQNLRCYHDNTGSIAINVKLDPTITAQYYNYTLTGSLTPTINVNNYPLNNYSFTGLPADNNYFLVVQVKVSNDLNNNGNFNDDFLFCYQVISITEPAPLSISKGPSNNVSCNGGNDGSLDAIVAGGPTAPYTYSWSNGATTQNISGLTAGNYILSIVDGNGCTKSDTFTVSEPPPLSGGVTATQISCSGANDGSITLTPTGGTIPYSSFLWSNGATTQNISGLAPGTYTVTFKDSKGCTGSASATINAAPAAITASATPTQITCNGANDGAITLTPSGGSGSYTSFVWSNGATTQNISGLAAGTYTVTIKDANGCTGNASATINPAPTAITATTTTTQITCNGANDGTITLTPSGGSGSYTSFVWSNGATTQNISGLAAGTYTVTFKDSKGCTGNASATINPAPAAVTATASVTQITCNSANDGSIALTPTGGTSPYSSFVWSNGATTQNISGLAAGTYTVTFKDSKGCTGNASATINPAPTTISATATATQITCNGANDGSIALTPAGGTPPYSAFAWSNGATTQNISGLTAGTYTVTFKDSNGCNGNASATINPAPATIIATATVTQITCNGANDGTITLSISGGSGSYTSFVWSNGATTQNISGLTAGTYTVTFKDSKGCSGSASATINPAPTAIIVTATATQITCNGANDGTITLSISGGSGSYTSFAWSNGATTQNISGLAAGTYTVTFKDTNGCTKNASATINPAPAAITAAAATTQITCNGANDGTITLTPSGGSGSYTSFVWSNGATTQNISGLAAGTYTVTFKDSKGCTGNASATINPAPSAVTATATPTQISCNGVNDGSIVLTPAGGSGTYTSFVWSNGATTKNISGLTAGTYTVTFKDSKGCSGSASATINPAPSAVTATTSATQITCNGANDGTITLTPAGGSGTYVSFVWSNGATTQNISGLAAGTYTVTFKDSKGCTGNASATINPAPSAITATGSVTNAACNGNNNGSVILSPSGGTVPYSYNWSNAATTKDLTNTAPGTYTVTITDKNNCKNTAPISFTINPTVTVTGTASASPAIVCSGQPSTVTAAINSPFTPAASAYSFNGGLTFQSSASFSIPGILGDTVVNVVVKDVNGCISNPIAVSITTSKINASISQTKFISCNGGNTAELTVNVVGNSTGYTYAINGGSAQVSNVFSNLSKGTYTIVIDDGTACKSSINSIITEPAVLTIAVKTIVNVDPCTGTGSTNGSVAVTANGGTPGYSFTLTPSGTTQADSLFSNLGAGNYTINIIDSKGCTANVNATVTQPPALTFTYTQTNPVCGTANSGSITVTPSGGVAPYTYLWSNNATSKDLSGITAGTYTLTITDSKNCQTTQSITVNPAPVVTGSATASPAIVCSGQGTTITATLDPAYTPASNAYSFDGGSTFLSSSSYSIANIVADTTATIILQDINGCLSNPIQVSITTSKINATVTETKSISCNGGNDGALTVTSTGSTVGYTYSINGGSFQTSNVFSNLSKGTYVIVINDGSACNSSYTETLTEPQPITLAVKSIVNVNPCAGGNNGSIQVTTTGGNAGKSFTITPSGSSQTDSLFNNLFAGNYTITVTDSKSCTANATASVIEPNGIDTASIVAVIVDNKCPGDILGSVKLTNVTGGVGPYTYTLNGSTNTTSVFTGLLSGTYGMTITDANGCSVNYPFTVHEPQPIIYTAVTVPSSCNVADGSIEITNVTGGIPPYKYSINDGQSYFTTSLFSSLADGTYHLRVSDNQCSYTKDVLLPTKPAPVPYVRVQQPTCYGGSDGAIVLDSISGGVPLFQYNFNNINVGSTTVYSDLSVGSYPLTITDQACTYAIDSFYIYNKTTAKYDTLSALKIPVTQPSPISALALAESTDRYENSGIAILYDIKGGTPGYFWSSDNVTFTAVKKDTVLITNQSKGIHTIYIKDSLGCKGSVEVTVQVEFFIPNLITPNNDGKNDRFEIMGLPKGSELKIVNRWGNQVYLSMNYDNTWGAEEDSDGVYYYELLLPNGEKHKGWIEVLR